MPIGDALLSIGQQLADDPFKKVKPAATQTLPTQLPDIFPRELLSANPTVPNPDAAKSTKRMGKFFTTLGDIIEDPRTRKALGAAGIALDAKGVGGALGQLGIDFAEQDAQAAFRAQLDAGGDPDLVKTPGLSVEGRKAVISERLAIEKQSADIENDALKRELDLFRSEQAQRRIEASERRVELLEDTAIRQSRQQEFEQEREAIKIELERLETERRRIETESAAGRRTAQTAQEQVDLERRERELRVDFARRRVEDLDSQIKDFDTQLRSANELLKSYQLSKGNKTTGKAFDRFTQQAFTVADLQRQREEIVTERDSLLKDIQSNLGPSQTPARTQQRQPAARTQPQTPNSISGRPFFQTPEQFQQAKVGDRFYVPGAAFGKRDPVLVELTPNGTLREIIQ